VKFTQTTLKDAVLIELEKRGDERGFFARTFCAKEFAAEGLETVFVQANTSQSALAGTLRGMHFQRPPNGEVKVIRCVKGAVYDVIIDLRSGSPTFGRWEGFELSEVNGRMLYVPKGFAHGFQTRADDTAVAYQVSHPYTPGAEGGLRWDDPAFAIAWPRPVTVLSDKDAAWPDADLATLAL
jgi:dTDP-4-dehydrorhamnose 3,5-epimerase